MRTLRLLSAAAEAEGLRLRREARATCRGAAFGAAAALFGIGALALLHIAAWLSLAEAQGAVQASLVLAMADAVVMAGLLVFGRRQRDPVAAAAAMMRDRSLEEARRTPLLADAAASLGLRRPLAAAGGAIAEGVVRALARR